MEEHRGDVRRHIFWTIYFIIQVRGKLEGVIKGGMFGSERAVFGLKGQMTGVQVTNSTTGMGHIIEGQVWCSGAY